MARSESHDIEIAIVGNSPPPRARGSGIQTTSFEPCDRNGMRVSARNRFHSEKTFVENDYTVAERHARRIVWRPDPRSGRGRGRGRARGSGIQTSPGEEERLADEREPALLWTRWQLRFPKNSPRRFWGVDEDEKRAATSPVTTYESALEGGDPGDPRVGAWIYQSHSGRS